MAWQDMMFINVSDNANTGSGGAKLASANISLIIERYDHSPVLKCPLERKSLEDTAVLIDFISLHDEDAPPNMLVEVNVSAKLGRLEFGSYEGVNIQKNENRD